MQIFPAIDLRGGQVVRLYQGDYDKETVYAQDPCAVARDFIAAGARYLHVVDLDGAKDGTLANLESIAAIARQGGLYIEVGGGIRDEDRIRRYLDLGVGRCILGTIAVKDFDFTERMAQTYGDRIAVGIDAKEGMVATEGWLDTSSVGYLDLAKEMEQAGVKTIIFTDISRDGMLGGLNLEQLAALEKAVSCNIIASGGVRDLRDIEACGRLGLHGVICGKALYTGSLSLREAIETAGDQPC